MSTGLLDALLSGERVLERQMAGVALVQPNLAASFTVKPEIDEGAKEFFYRFYQRRKEIKAAEPKQAIAIALSCVPSWADAYRFLGAIDNLDTVQLAAEVEQNLTAMRTSRKAAAWLEKSELMRLIASEVQL
jgi:hypothetical protein